MPEIPEVEAFGVYIKNHCLHKTIDTIQAKSPQLIHGVSFSVFKKMLAGDQFSTVSRLGKYLVIDFKKTRKKLIMHFGLTGFLSYTSKPETIRFSCVTFIFNDHSELHWNSVRKFAKLWLVDSIDDLKLLKNMGVDPQKLTEKQFLDLVAENKQKNVKTFLMDQEVIAGIGNEYSDEILFQAGIDPRHKLSDLSVKERKSIFKEMNTVLKYAIKLRLKHLNEVSAGEFFSKKGGADFPSSYLQAHRHGDGLCPHDEKHKLSHVKIGGRTAYFCPVDQR